MKINRLKLILLLPVLCIQEAAAEAFPDVMGTWSGDVLIVQAGTSQVAKGGMEIADVNLKVQIDYQHEGSFMGRSRNSQMPGDQPSVRVWGTIRSNHREAIFLTSNGGRGQLWFDSEGKSFEYCITNLQNEVATAYCAQLTKEN
jgi:hypothetical protein